MQRLNFKNIVWILTMVAGYFLIDLLIRLNIINSFYEITLVTTMINIIYAVGLNLILGVAGQFSLGHAGFIAIGAYSSAILSKSFENPVLGMAVGMVVGMVLALVLAVLVGIPTLRLKGDYLAIATLGVSEIVRVLINNMRDITNGPAGINNIPSLTTWQLTYILLIITTIIIVNYARSSAGRATRSINEDEIAAEAMGVNVTKYKVIAFVLGAMTAAIGGTLQANYLGIVTPNDYAFTRSIDILIIVVFGGIGSFTGSFVAAILLGLINLFLQEYGQLRMVLYAVALVLIMIFRPGGLLGTSEFKIGSWAQRFFKSKEEAV